MPFLVDYCYISSSSSSCRAISRDITDPLLLPLPIVPRFRQVLWVISHIYTELMYVCSSWSPCLCSDMWRGPHKYITDDLVPTPPAVCRMSGSSNLDSFRDRWLVAVQLLFFRVLPPGLVQYCSQHSCVVVVKREREKGSGKSARSVLMMIIMIYIYIPFLMTDFMHSLGYIIGEVSGFMTILKTFKSDTLVKWAYSERLPHWWYWLHSSQLSKHYISIG